MARCFAAFAVLSLLTAVRPAAAQTVVVPATYCPPVVSYYPAPAPAPAVSYYTPAPVYAPPAVSYYPAPTVAYYPAPTVSYYAAPAVSYYSAPVTTYYAAPAVTTYYRYGPRKVRATSYYYYPY